MRDEGVEFITNAHIGVDQPVEKLREDFDAIALCCGATKPRDLPIDGRDFEGVHFAMDYLAKNTQTLLSDNPGDFPINAEGKDVVVVGGGDTGTDCVGSSLRQGCKSLTQLEIMPRPADERMANNPWPEWPKVYRLDYGQEENIALNGKDPREYLVMTKRFIDDGEGNLTGLEIVDIEWAKDEQGRMFPKDVEGSLRKIPCQLSFLAMGFLGPEQSIVDKLKLETDNRSNVKAEYGKFATSLEGVFAAGDMRRGQSLVVWAINEGRGCARELDVFLMGSTNLQG